MRKLLFSLIIFCVIFLVHSSTSTSTSYAAAICQSSNDTDGPINSSLSTGVPNLTAVCRQQTQVNNLGACEALCASNEVPFKPLNGACWKDIDATTHKSQTACIKNSEVPYHFQCAANGVIGDCSIGSKCQGPPVPSAWKVAYHVTQSDVTAEPRQPDGVPGCWREFTYPDNALHNNFEAVCCIPPITPQPPTPTKTPTGSSGGSGTGTPTTVTDISVSTADCASTSTNPSNCTNVISSQESDYGQKSSRDFPQTGVSDGAWPVLWPPLGNIVSWCDASKNVYAKFTWNKGYTDATANAHYKLGLWISDFPPNPKEFTTDGATTLTLKFDPKYSGLDGASWVSNGWYTQGTPEIGWPHTYFILADCNAAPPTVTPAPTTNPIPSGPPGTATANIKIRLDSFDLLDASQNSSTPARQPKHTTRNVKIYLYKTTNYVDDLNGDHATNVISGTVSWSPPDPNAENFQSTVGMYVNPNQSLGIITPDNYYVFIRTEGSLMQPLSNPPTLTPIVTSAINVLNFTTPLHMGKLAGNENRIGVLDFNVIQTCYGATLSIAAKSDCLAFPNIKDNLFNNIPITDLNDDGKVDGIDYNIFIRNFGLSGF